MKKSYKKIRLAATPGQQEQLIADLLDLGYSRFLEEDTCLEAYKDLEKESEPDQLLSDYLHSAGITLLEDDIIEEQNWNQEWEKTIQPRQVGRFYIHPTWNTQKIPDDLTPIAIDPKMAFGTGYHETTRLILRLLPSYVRKGQSVLDMGTGTGVLAIAALKLGAERALGVDIDPWSYENARENANLNKVASTMDVRTGSMDVIDQKETFDLILANINRNSLLDLSDDLVNRLAPGGTILLSGILQEDEEAILNNPAYATLKRENVMTENEWMAIALNK